MYEVNYTADLTDPRRPLLTISKFSFGDIFPNNVFYKGSTFQIQEIATIEISVDDQSLIDVDLNYYEPNLFLGSWQVFRFTGLELGGARQFFYPGTNEPITQGRITGTEVKLVRTSLHTIGDSSRSARTNTQLILDGCNTDIRPALVRVFDDFERLVQGDKFSATEAIFIGRTYDIVPPLADEFFFGQLEAIGLYISPGASFTSARYRAAVINGLDQLGDEVPAFTCGTNEVDCIGQLRDALAGSTTQFATEEECLIANPTGCLPYDYFLGGDCGLVAVWEAGLGPP